MSEKEKFDTDHILYRNLLEMLPVGSLPVSKEDFEIVQRSLGQWYEGFGSLHKVLREKYGDSVVRNTRLHHLLSGSSRSFHEWESFPDDTPGGEMADFARSIVEKYGPESEKPPE